MLPPLGHIAATLSMHRAIDIPGSFSYKPAMPRSIKAISVQCLDFDSIARSSDEDVYKHMAFTCSGNKKRVIPKAWRWNGYRVSRTPNSITVHLLAKTDADAKAKEVGLFSFIPSPRFA